MKRAAVVLGLGLAAASPALGDTSLPPAPPPKAAAIVDDEPATHAPPLPPRPPERSAPGPTAATEPPASWSRGADERPSGTDDANPDRPLDFVDATLQSGDLAARFHSARPVVKHAPAPRRTKVLHAR